MSTQNQPSSTHPDYSPSKNHLAYFLDVEEQEEKEEQEEENISSPNNNTPRKVKRLTPSVRREIDLKNHARQLAGLSLITIKVRKCIVCNKLFESSGKRSCGCQSRRSGYIAGREII
ncbi:MAG: hypothetical protein OXC44_06790 [Proteobacteria bacterium]|nr:hypothetical protein [Pseudomonadota bacterium]